jgi:acyl-coenzyme A synthetase/AMP-(fatty) acid ligase
MIEHPAKQLAVCFALLRSGYDAAPIYAGLLPHLRGTGIQNLIYEAEGHVLSGGRNIRFDSSWLPGSRPVSPRTASGKRANLIFFTSGSTGLPKRVVQTEGATLARLANSPLTGIPSYSRVMILPGLSSSYGFCRVCEVLREGRTACFSLSDESRLVLISTYGVEHLVASPQQALGLADLCDANPGYQLDSLDSIWISGAFASRDAIKRIQSTLCRNVVIAYGATETGLVAVAPFDMIADIPDAVGFVSPWTELEIVDDAGRAVPAGTEGLIRYRTPFFIASYAANHPGEPDGSRDVWHYPGDLGAVTANGVLCVRGRGDDVINCGGMKVSAVSLDEVVLRCSGVKDGAVCGIKGTSGLEELWIGVVPGPRFELATFQRELEQDQRFKELLQGVGAEVVAVDAIPRSQLGKIQRHELREKLLKLQTGSRPQ